MSIDRLKLYHESEVGEELVRPPPANLDVGMRDDEFCEVIPPEGGENEEDGEIPMEGLQEGPAEAPGEPVPAPLDAPRNEVEMVVAPPPAMEETAEAPVVPAQVRKARQLAAEAEGFYGTLPQGRRRRHEQ